MSENYVNEYRYAFMLDDWKPCEAFYCQCMSYTRAFEMFIDFLSVNIPDYQCHKIVSWVEVVQYSVD